MITTTYLCLEVHWGLVGPELAFLTNMALTGLTNPLLTRRTMLRAIRVTIRQVDLDHLGGAQRHLRLMPTTWNGGPRHLSAKYSLVLLRYSTNSAYASSTAKWKAFGRVNSPQHSTPSTRLRWTSSKRPRPSPTPFSKVRNPAGVQLSLSPRQLSPSTPLASW
jgi:hypothetical protein